MTKTVAAAAAAGGLLPRIQPIIVKFNVMGLGSSGLFFSGLTGILLDLLYVVVLCVTIVSEMNGMVFRR